MRECLSKKVCVFCLITLTNIHFLYFCRFFLKFFLKCNQNCLKNAGNPRDMRRFQVHDSGPWSRLNTVKVEFPEVAIVRKPTFSSQGLWVQMSQDGFI